MDPVIKKTKTEEVPLDFEYNGSKYYGVAIRLATNCSENNCFELDVILNNKYLGSINCDQDFKCTMPEVFDKGMVEKVAEEIMLWYL